jgi:hypothetical protein
MVGWDDYYGMCIENENRESFHSSSCSSTSSVEPGCISNAVFTGLVYLRLEGGNRVCLLREHWLSTVHCIVALAD